MKRWIAILTLLCALVLTGCGRETSVDGTVTAVEESRFTMVTDEGMEVIVNGATADWPVVAENARIRVYFNGVMTLSLPGQIGAQLIVTAE